MYMNAKQREFVSYYVEIGNAADAARKAGYSKRSARQTGFRLLKRGQIQEALEEEAKVIRSQRTIARNQASMMLLSAFGSATNATEMRLAADALSKLHDLV
jgi:phage terminase small subunit